MSKSETKIDTLEIGGMHCASCVAAVEKALSGVPGVERASVNLATEKATVEHDASRELDDELRRAVEKAGFEVKARPQTVVLEVTGMHCASCSANIEKALNRLDGVRSATVNLATEKATVELLPHQVRIDDLRALLTMR